MHIQLYICITRERRELENNTLYKCYVPAENTGRWPTIAAMLVECRTHWHHIESQLICILTHVCSHLCEMKNNDFQYSLVKLYCINIVTLTRRWYNTVSCGQRVAKSYWKSDEFCQRCSKGSLLKMCTHACFQSMCRDVVRDKAGVVPTRTLAYTFVQI